MMEHSATSASASVLNSFACLLAMVPVAGSAGGTRERGGGLLPFR